ncbi:MAG: crotonase/enoyl-CoA hydratase family protein [Thermoleophilia bacterium]|nr:crotonase/enoyl-CoA hydratase family protein [Thermoleophilia bacterium]
MALVSYETRETTAVLTIDRPERRNAVDAATAAELLGGLRRFEADEELRVMVLTGAGDQAFCAGADLKALAEAGTEVPADVIEQVAGRPEGPMGFTRLVAAKPVIAAIGGWCLAGGLELALWCDLRIAGRGSRLGYPERRWGVPLIDGGTLRLPRIVGLGRALDLILTGRIIDADEALDWGLLTEVVDDGRHLDRALELAAAIARFPQRTMLSDRRSAIEGSTLPLAEGLELEAELGLGSVRTGLEGAARFAAGEGRGGV